MHILRYFHPYLETMHYVLFVYNLAHLFPDWTACTLFTHHLLHFNEEVLLRTEDGAGTGDSDPSYEVSCREVVVFHRVETDQSASTTKTSLAVHC